MITVLLAEDHRIVRQGLQALLGAVPEFSLLSEAGDGLEALKCVELHQPDVLVLDLMLPGLHGLEVARQTKKRSPRTRIVVLSMHASEAYVAEALRAGATGYVLKQSSASELAFAIREAVAGRRFLSPPLSEQSVEVYECELKTSTTGPHKTLTPREREILQLVAEGHTNAAIAGRLGISPRTVETHRNHLMRKLNLHTRADLIRYAIQHGLAPME
jgi:DNA-binding NarL/FixJ family response regulator